MNIILSLTLYLLPMSWLTLNCLAWAQSTTKNTLQKIKSIPIGEKFGAILGGMFLSDLHTIRLIGTKRIEDWDWRTNQRSASWIVDFPMPISGMQLSWDYKLILLEDENTIQLRSMPTGNVLHKWNKENEPLHFWPHLSPTGRWLSMQEDSDSPRLSAIWDTKTFMPAYQVDLKDLDHVMFFAKDEYRFLTVAKTGQIKIYPFPKQ